MLKIGVGEGDEHISISFPYALRKSLVTDSGPRTVLTLLMRKNSCSLKHKSTRINILVYNVSLIKLKIRIALSLVNII